MSATASSKLQGAAPGTSSAASVSKRLQQDLMQMMMSGNKDISAFPQADNLFEWVATMKGSKGTVYEGCTFKLLLKFPADYPFSAPTITFTTPCWHPNVDQAGNICLDILKDKWSAAYSVSTVLMSLQTLLGDANPASPLNSEAAAMWPRAEEYRRMVVRKYTEATGKAPEGAA